MFDFRPLRSATFRRLLATYSINELGNWIGEIALAVLVFDRTHSPLATAGLFLAIKFVPAILASFLTTAIVTRRPGTTLAVLYIIEAALFAGMAVVSSHFLLAAMLALAGIDAVLATAATALRRSVTATRLLADDLLREGNAIINIGFTAASAIGPALAGVLVAASGPGGALWVDGASFALVAVVIVGVRDDAADASGEGGALQRLQAGLTEVWRRREVRGLLGALAVGLMFGSIVIPIEVVFAKQTLHAGATGYGALLACWGVGHDPRRRRFRGGATGTDRDRADRGRLADRRRLRRDLDLLQPRGGVRLLGPRRTRQRRRIDRGADGDPGGDAGGEPGGGDVAVRGHQPRDAVTGIRSRRRDRRPQHAPQRVCGVGDRPRPRGRDRRQRQVPVGRRRSAGT